MVGPTAASMGGSYIESTQGFELGIAATIVLDHQFGDRWAVVTGLGWVQKGGKVSHARPPLPTPPMDSNRHTCRYHFSPRAALPVSGGPWFIAPFAGVAMGLKVGCKYKNAAQLEFEEDGCDEHSPGGGSHARSNSACRSEWIYGVSFREDHALFSRRDTSPA